MTTKRRRKRLYPFQIRSEFNRLARKGRIPHLKPITWWEVNND